MGFQEIPKILKEAFNQRFIFKHSETIRHDKRTVQLCDSSTFDEEQFLKSKVRHRKVEQFAALSTFTSVFFKKHFIFISVKLQKSIY